MNTITLTRHEFSSFELLGLAGKKHRPWIRRRINALAAVTEGSMSREAIARKHDTDSDQARLWIKRYNTEGLKGLEDKPGRGAKRKLTPKQEMSLKKSLQKSPKKSGIQTNLWTGRAVQEYLEKRRWFSCSMPEAYVIIHRLGFTLQRPGQSPMEADPKAEARFFKELREKKAAYPDAIYLAEDEAALISIPTITRMWALKGTQPIIPTRFGTKERRTLFGAVNLRNGALTGQIADTGNTETFRLFLFAIRKRYPRGSIVIILDNVRFHHAQAIQMSLQRYPRLSFLFLPPYYPKLNPQEMVWQILRRTVTHNAYYPAFAQEVAAAKRFFKNTIVDIKNTPTSLIIRK